MKVPVLKRIKLDIQLTVIKLNCANTKRKRNDGKQLYYRNCGINYSGGNLFYLKKNAKDKKELSEKLNADHTSTNLHRPDYE